MTQLGSSLEDRLQAVRGRMAAASLRASRAPESARLIVVSKGRSADAVRRVYAAGARDFGENRVEEGVPKAAECAGLSDVRWHMIGHLQSRKADRVLPTFSIVHSVDRWKIARVLNEQASRAGGILPVLLECNVSGETSKEGWDFSRRDSWERGMADLLAVRGLEHLRVIGLMTMAPIVEGQELARPVFRALSELSALLRQSWPECGGELSMGMTDDFEVAIEEGATMVRIGRAVFGDVV
jgi:pyridoxal phosphate enzyme (YggS family)